ncbi:MAG: hypothetical protein ACHQ01_01670 [Candidatus Limnocylindrales bacterium]
MVSDLPPHRRTRIHEAAHAVAQVALGMGWPFEVRSDEDSGHNRGFGQNVDASTILTSAEWRAFLEGRAICLLAGAAALQVFGDPDPVAGADWDRTQAAKAIAKINDPVVSMNSMYRRALELVRQHRGSILRFANALARADGRLSGWELRAALDAALADPSEPARAMVSSAEFIARLRASRPNRQYPPEE